jgi:acyl dehydratase
MASADSPPNAVAAISPAIVGYEVGPMVQAIDARWLMAYSAAVGALHPRYFDTTRASGPDAHPLFAVCYEWPLMVALRDRALGDAVARAAVHARHHLVIHRLPRAADELRTTARIIGVEPRRSGTLVTVRFTTMDDHGQPVTTTHYGSVFRGVPLAAAGRSEESPPELRGGATTDVRWSESIEIRANLAHVYTECARIWNPIHTDIAVARAAGLPGIVLHGTATLALAVSRLIDRELGGDPIAVREVTARFSAMVPLPSRYTLRARARGDDLLPFDAVAADGAVVLDQGALRV